MTTPDPTGRTMRLRYAGTCRVCASPVAAGQSAVYLKASKQIECLPCSSPPETDPTEPVVLPVDAGTAGASARREHQRRQARRDDRVRAAHPKLGGLILALTDEPQHTRAWERGAVGEEKLARTLDKLAERGARVLHDRRLPRSRANIDHVLVCPAGVFVIDAKRYAGRPRLQVDGGFLRPQTETLRVGNRNCTGLVAGVQKQLAVVQTILVEAVEAVEPPPIRGMLCFVDADWPLIGGSFTISGIDVLWPNKIADRAFQPAALTPDRIDAIHRRLATALPPA